MLHNFSKYFSPMSHFSSPSGLLSHPGLSSSGQLPHLKQEFSGKDSGAHLKSKCMKSLKITFIQVF